MAASVPCALRVRGSRNALTPLLTASTPVMAVHPAANVRSSSQNVSPSDACPMAGGGTTGRMSPFHNPQTPARITPPSPAMNT